MEYYNRTHCKYTGIKGILKLYNNAIRYRYMITEKAKYKAKVLILWEKHGIQGSGLFLVFWHNNQMEKHDFLKKKYDLHNAPETEAAARRSEMRGREIPQNPKDRIQNYLGRFTEIINRKEPAKRERGIEALKEVLHDKFIIKEEEIPEGYFLNQQRLAREQGHGDIEISEEQKAQLSEVVIADQKSSFDAWIDYLASNDATYPDWLKYYAFRSVTGMGEYDKEKKQFTKRSKGTVKPFPDINREALAYVLDAIEKKYKSEKINLETLEQEDKAEFNKLLQGENFAKLYAWAIDKVTPASEEALANTAGQWVKYRHGVDHMPLVESLQGHGTGWCTAGESTAKVQLENGDFYVYYSYDENKKPNIPRAAIRMQGGQIAEVRGIAEQQNLDPYIGDVVKQKLAEFPDGKAYEKKSSDMKLLTEIENKNNKGEQLSKNDLIFLYEINSQIEGFGYQRDPRIEELRDRRNKEEDMPIVFECGKTQIAHNAGEIKKDIKAYVGKLESGIFQKLPENLENIYTSFPEGKISKFEMAAGGESKENLLRELGRRKNLPDNDKDKIYTSDYAEDMLKNVDFEVLKDKEGLSLVRLRVGDLGFPNGATTDEIYKRAEELGLELCPAETGVDLRLNYKDIFNKEQPIGEWFRIAMKQIADRFGNPYVFYVGRSTDGWAWLYDNDARPDSRWYPDCAFVFRFRKFEI